MATLQSGKCFTVPTYFGMCCRSEWQERMYIYKWHEVDQTKHEIFCVHIVCNEIQVKVNLEITTFYFYLRFPYCPNFFWFGVVEILCFWGLFNCDLTACLLRVIWHMFQNVLRFRLGFIAFGYIWPCHFPKWPVIANQRTKFIFFDNYWSRESREYYCSGLIEIE